MADELSFNFGIENTEMGNAELLNDIFGQETVTSNPNELQEIKEPVKEKAPESKKATENPPEKEPKNFLSDFLEKNVDEEDVPDKKPVEKEKKAETPVEEPEEDTSPFSTLSKELFTLGVFVKDEDEEDVHINTPEEFLDRFNSEKKKGAVEIVNNFIGQFGEDYQNAFDAIFVKGVNPRDYFGTYNTVVSFAEMDMTLENNQEAVLRQAFTDQGFDPEDITTEIERLKNYGDLETVAVKHHKVLVKKEALKLQQMEQKAEQDLQQKNAFKNQYIKNVQQVLQEKLKTKEFDGIPINPKLVDELQDFLLVDRYKTSSGDLLTDFDKTILELKRPENHHTKVKLALLIKLLEKDPTLSTIQKSGLTKKSDQLFGEVARQVTKANASKGATPSKANSWFL